MGGLIYQKVISPLSGNRKRIIDNLELVFPNLEKEKQEEEEEEEDEEDEAEYQEEEEEEEPEE